MAWLTFATQTSPEPMSNLDTQFGNVAKWSAVGCTASGTNVITLTPILSGFTGPAYANFAAYRFAAANSNGGATTLKVGSLSALNCYRADGTTQITTGDIISGQCYEAVYNSALNSAAGGFYITNIGQGASSLPDPVTPAHGGTGLTTLTANNVLIGAGTSNVTFVAPSTSGNVLTSNGTVWQSTAPSGTTYSAGAGLTLTSTTFSINTNNANGIGAYNIGVSQSGGIAAGNTTTFAGLTIDTTGGIAGAASTGNLAGTWRNVCGQSISTVISGMCIRTA